MFAAIEAMISAGVGHICAKASRNIDEAAADESSDELQIVETASERFKRYQGVPMEETDPEFWNAVNCDIDPSNSPTFDEDHSAAALYNPFGRPEGERPGRIPESDPWACK